MKILVFEDCSSHSLLGDGRQAPLSGDLKSFHVDVSFKLFDHNLLFFELLFELPLLFDELRQFGL